ncbi:MAG: hypothetical protein ALECFALPRED_009888, partial [Alectoria fallacina]
LQKSRVMDERLPSSPQVNRLATLDGFDTFFGHHVFVLIRWIVNPFGAVGILAQIIVKIGGVITVSPVIVAL